MTEFPNINKSFSEKNLKFLNKLLDQKLLMFLMLYGPIYLHKIEEINDKWKNNSYQLQDSDNIMKVMDAELFICKLMGITLEEKFSDLEGSFRYEKIAELAYERINTSDKKDYEAITKYVKDAQFEELKAEDMVAIAIHLAELMKNDNVYEKSTIKKKTLFRIVNDYLVNHPLYCNDNNEER